MAISIILAHPNKGSFNHAIADVAAKALRGMGYDLWFHDLCAEGFDPLLTGPEIPKDAPLDPVLQRHCDEIRAAEGIVVVHPNWWAMPPAILKGWVDRVLRQGIAYEFGVNEKGEHGPIGWLAAKAAVVFHTSNTPPDLEVKLYGDPLANLWRTCIFGFCGIRNVTRRLYASVIMSTPDQRQAWLRDVQATILQAFGGK